MSPRRGVAACRLELANAERVFVRREDEDNPDWRARTRLTAGLMFVASVGLIATNVWAFHQGRQSALALALLFAPALMLLSAGALVHPPLLYSFGPRRPLLDPGTRRLGTVLGVIGLVLGVATT